MKQAKSDRQFKKNDIVVYSEQNNFIKAILLENPETSNIALCKVLKASNKTIIDREIYFSLSFFAYLKSKSTFYGVLKDLIK